MSKQRRRFAGIADTPLNSAGCGLCGSTPNYLFKPTAEDKLRSSGPLSRSGGLTRRYASGESAVADDDLKGAEKRDLAIQTGLQLIPYVGGSLCTLYFGTKQEKRFKRIESFYRELAEELSQDVLLITYWPVQTIGEIV